MRNLGTLGGSQSRARSINDRTEVVGFSEIRPGSGVTRAFLWTEVGGMRSLGTLGGESAHGPIPPDPNIGFTIAPRDTLNLVFTVTCSP